MTTITSFSPLDGPVTGGTVVTIIGTGFNIPPIVTIDGIAANVIYSSATSIAISTPQNTVGAKVLTVDGTDAANLFTYYTVPECECTCSTPVQCTGICPAPPYNATNFTSSNSVEFNTLLSYANNEPNYPWNTGTDAQQVYRSRQNISYFSGINQRTKDIKNENNNRIASGLPGDIQYPQFKSQAERLMYVQGMTLTSARNQLSGKNLSPPMGVPCSTIYEIIN